MAADGLKGGRCDRETHELCLPITVDPRKRLKSSFFSGNAPHLFSTLAETRSRRRRESGRRYSRVVGRQQEVQQQADGLLGADLVGGGHALVQLAKDGGEHHL